MNNDINQIFCANCGKKNLSNNNFCVYCGTHLNVNQQVNSKIDQEDTNFYQSDFIQQQTNSQFVQQSQQKNVTSDEKGSSKKSSVLIIFAFIGALLFFTSFGIEGFVIFGLLLVTYILFGNANNAYGIILKVIGGIFLFFTVMILILFGVCFFGINMIY